MKLIAIEAECRAGTKTDETLSRFNLGQRLIEICKVVFSFAPPAPSRGPDFHSPA